MSKKLILFFFSSIVNVCVTFPDNLTPISIFDNASRRVFTGDDVNKTASLYVQILKELDLGGKRRIAVAGREQVFFIDPHELENADTDETMNYQQVLAWESREEAQTLCTMKGQPKALCYNFISILQLIDKKTLFICGTNSYSPKCATYEVSENHDAIMLTQNGDSISGKHISPFGPDQRGASLFTDGSLFSATYQSIFGGSPVITRTMGKNYPLRTETSSRIMRDPEFIKVSEDSQRVLFFFNEKEVLRGGEKRTIAQVAQVCKNDRGGDRILERMFTTFIKARLNCSYNGFYLDEVRAVTDPVTVDGQSLLFATFATPENSLPGSAVCSFFLSDVHSSFFGPFADNFRGSTSQNTRPFTATRHPGKCGDEKLTDPELVYIKSHPQMQKQVTGSLLLTSQGKRWTAIAIDVAAGPNKAKVLYIGTETGQLLRSLMPPNGNAILLSEQNVFDETKCSSSDSDAEKFFDERRIETILIEGNAVLIGFKHCVVSVPLRMCSQHRCQAACFHSSDPYCVWNGTSCASSTNKNHRDFSATLKLSNEPCLDEHNLTLNEEENQDKNVIKTTPHQIFFKNTSDNHLINIFPQEQNKICTIETLLIACVCTFAATLMLIILMFFCWRHCSSPHEDAEDFGSKQIQTQHKLARNNDGKTDSYRKIRYCGWKFWICKMKTPVQSPIVVSRDRLRRKDNDYSDSPFPKDKDLEQRSCSETISRINSKISSTSRQDSIQVNRVSQSRLSHASIPVSDSTLGKDISEQSTLPYTIKPTGDSSSSSNSRSSGCSPPIVETERVSKKAVSDPNYSDKTRRRNEKAEQQATEIMRESYTAIRGVEDSLFHMQQLHESGLLEIAPLSHQPSLNYFLPRQRIDSHDSGKGESCRNSFWIHETESSYAGSKQQRPSSLNFQKTMSIKRKRLHSEGSCDPVSPNVFYGKGRERRYSGNNTNSSHSSTPVVEQQRCPLTQTGSDVVSYGIMIQDNKNPNFVLHPQQFKSQRSFPAPGTPTKIVHFQQSPLKPKTPVSDGFQTNYCHSFYSNNHYPSLQVRGSHAQKQIQLHPTQHQKLRSYSPSYNYYPSLPLHGSEQMYKLRMPFEAVGSIDRHSLTRKKEESVAISLSRQASLPPSNRPVVLVPPMPAITTDA